MGRTRHQSRWTSSALGSSLVAGGLLLSASARAQEEPADPAAPTPATQFDFGLRAVTSVNGTTSYGGAKPQGTIDFSDTYAYARGRTPLFSPNDRAGALLAITFPDQYYEPGTLLIAEANAFDS